MNHWKHTKTILDGEHYEIKGINIWDHSWIKAGEQVKIKDPIYNQDYTFNVYTINHLTISIEFAAGEFSNNVWGIYEMES